jgi:DNA-damage-inducible protein J
MLTHVAREKTLPFEPLVPNSATIAAMKDARQGGLRSFATVADLMADLNAARLSRAASSGALSEAHIDYP